MWRFVRVGEGEEELGEEEEEEEDEEEDEWSTINFVNNSNQHKLD